MKIGDLVKSRREPEGFDSHSREWLGMVMEAEEYEGQIGYWVEYFEDREHWSWYSFDEYWQVEVINEC